MHFWAPAAVFKVGFLVAIFGASNFMHCFEKNRNFLGNFLEMVSQKKWKHAQVAIGVSWPWDFHKE